MAKFTAGVVDTGCAPRLANISANSKKFEMTLLYFRGLGGSFKLRFEKKEKFVVVTHEKNLIECNSVFLFVTVEFFITDTNHKYSSLPFVCVRTENI